MILHCDVIVECDGCGEEVNFTVDTPNQGFGPDQLKHALRGDDWELRHTSQGIKTLCPACNGDQ